MKRTKLHIFWFFFLFLLAHSGCSPIYTLVPENQRIQVGNTFIVNPSIAWSKHPAPSTETWTVDGPLLQRLVFIPGIKDGEPLVKQSTETKDFPVFHENMSPIEVKELFEATMSRMGAHQIAIANGVEWLTSDFNCTVTEPGYVNEILDRLVLGQPRIYGMILYVE